MEFDHPLPKDTVLLSQVSNASGCRSPKKSAIGKTRSFGEIEIAAKVNEIAADKDHEEADSQSHAVSVPLVRATEYVNATDKRTLAGDLASSVPLDGNHPVLHSVVSGTIDSKGPASPRSPKSDLPGGGAYELGDLLSGPEDLDLNEIRGMPVDKSKFRKKFWIWLGIGIVQAIATITGVCILIWGPKALTTDFQVWRICFFIALAPATWILANFVTYLLIKLVEKTMMTVLNALYFAYAVRKHIRWVVRALLILILWALMMMVETSAQEKDINDAYKIILEILACVLIFTIGNLLKRLGAKYMALKFHETAHHEKMKTALRKEHYLKSLLRPRMRAAKELERDGMAPHQSLPSLFYGRRPKSFYSNNASKQWSEISSNISSKSRNKDMSFFSEMHNASNHNNNERSNGKSKSAGFPINITIESLDQRNEGSGRGLGDLEEDKADDLKVSHEGSEHDIGDEDTKMKHFPRLDIPHDDINNPKVRANVLHHLTKLEHYIRKTSLEVTFRDELNRVEKSNVSTDLDAKRVAYYLFWNLKPDVGASYISEKDLKPFLWESEVPDAFQMLDVDKDDKIKLRDCIESVKLIHKERRNLALTLRDAKTINNSLEFLLGLVIHLLLIFIYLWILGADNVSQAWLSFSGIILAFSFIFATAMQQAFENIIFLYSVRSYMTGDTLLYNGQFLTVQEISINYTCFMSDLNQQFWIATTEIRRTPFVNLSNSGNKWEIINILVDADSDPEVLKLIQGIVANLHKDNPKEYGPGQRARYNKAVDPFKFNIQVLFEYSHNGLDLFRTAMARSYVMEKISEVLRSKSVSYTLPSIRPDALAQQQDEAETDLQVQATQNRDVFTRLANVAPF